MSFPPSVFKTWINGEVLTASDLNSSMQVIANSNITEDIDDFSTNTAEMQSNTDPYPAASPSLPNALDGEITRLRYIIKQITGKSQWYIDCAAIGSKGADVASANALVLGTDGNVFDITGTTAITSIGTLGTGSDIELQFDGAVTLTHHSTNLILPGGKNILTIAGDVARLREYGTGTWMLTNYTRNKALLSKGADIVSANALALGSDGDFFDVTGTTAITSIGTRYIGAMVTLQFDGALTLTHHATNLILPRAANITTAAGDVATFVEYGTGTWHCVGYTGTGIQLLGKGTATNDSAAAGYVGEVILSTVSSFAAAAGTATFGNITSISLTAGDWDVYGSIEFRNNGATETAGPQGAISINSANTTTDHIEAYNQLQTTIPTAAGFTALTVVYRLSLSGTTTTYLKAKRTFSGGSPENAGTIWARRAR